MTEQATATLQALTDDELARVALIAAALPATLTLPLGMDWEQRQWVVAEVLAAAKAVGDSGIGAPEQGQVSHPPLEQCQPCGGRGTWEVECCNGSSGCPCRGDLVEMGSCHACGGQGYVEPGGQRPMANANFILSNNIGYPGGGPR